MKLLTPPSSYRLSGCLFGTALALTAGAVSAQETPAAEAPAAPAPAAEAAPEAAAAPDATLSASATAEPAPAADVAEDPAAAEPAPAVEEPAVEEPVAAEAPAAEEAPPADKPTLNVGMGIRTGLAMTFDDPAADGPSLRLYDGLVDQFNLRPYFSGQLTDSVGFTANFETGSGTGLGFNVLDAIVQLKVMDEFQVWIGQHIPASDRANINGPFYNLGWNFPLGVHTYPFDVAARDRGVTFWGLVADGMLKYKLSAVDLQPSAGGTIDDGDGDPTNDIVTEGAGLGNARFAARAVLHLWDPENFYYNSGTYYGSQDVLAIGATIHSQKGIDGAGGEDLDNDFMGFSADLLIDKNLDESGVITFEAGYWNFEGTGYGYVNNQGTVDAGTGVNGGPVASSYMAQVAWLAPSKMGIGKLQPNLRFQMMAPKAETGPDPDASTVIDAGVAYIIDGYDHRWHLNFQHMDPGGDADAIQMLQIGAQFQM